MSREYLDLKVNRHNPALFSPSAGSAPYNEVTAMHNNTQRDHNEATLPDEYATQPTGTDLPDGFRWGKQANGKPIAVPTRDNIAELHELVSELYNEREMRYQELEADSKLTKALSTAYRQLADVNEYLANGFLYSTASHFAQELANAVSWVRIHAGNVDYQSRAGNEQAAENSLVNLEASRAQALKAAQVLDFVAQHDIEPNLMKGVTSALGLAGWRLANPKVSQNRKAVQQTTRDYLWSNPPKQPDEQLEDDLAEAMNG